MKPKQPGRWKAGESGSPAGKKPETDAAAKSRASMAAHVSALVTALLERAMAGDLGAARPLLGRTIAPLKAVEQSAPLALPGGSLAEQGRAVIAAVALGELASGQGAALLTSIGTFAKPIEVDELPRRIDALEACSMSGGGRHEYQDRTPSGGAGGPRLPLTPNRQ